MYNDRRKKIIKISLVIIGIIILVLLYLFFINKKTNSEENTRGKFFLDLGSLITGKKQSPDGISQTGGTDTEDNKGDNSQDNGLKNNSPFVIAGLPSPTPIAQNIGGGFGTNNIDLLPNGENPNNCIGCINPGPGDEPIINSDSDSSSVFISAVPSSVHKNDEVTISWDSYNVRSCSASSFPTKSGWSGAIAKTGTKSLTINTPTTFVIKCITTTSSVQASDSVSIVPDEIPVCDTNNCSQEEPGYEEVVSVVMSASPYMVSKDSTSNLTWDSENANTCTAESIPLQNDWRGIINQPEGDTNVTLRTTPITYILTCTDGKTTGQTDVTISVDTSGIGDVDLGDEPTNLCDQLGQEKNPLCLAKDISSEEEARMLILTDEEQAILDSLMKEVAIMSPTLPSNQTSSNLNISTQTYRTILNDTQINASACYDLTQDGSKNQNLIDALWERQIAGRRDGGSLPKSVVSNYPVQKPSATLLQKYRTLAQKPEYSWTRDDFSIDYGDGDRFSESGANSADNADYNNLGDPGYKFCPGRRYTALYGSVAGHGQQWGGEQLEGTFIFPPLLTSCYLMNAYKTDEDDAQKGIYDKVPGYGRMKEQVEYGSDTKGIKIY